MMRKGMDPAARAHARAVFEHELLLTGDLRSASREAGVSERTGRRWRAGRDPAARPGGLRRLSAKTNVRAAPDRFVGRGSELEGIHRLFLAGARLVTIVGPPGMGKSRLAQRYAELHLADFAMFGGGGAWTCEVADALDVEDVRAVLGRAIGLVVPSPEIGRALADRGRILVVLDGFEHVAAGAAATIGGWLDAAPAARFLVTSRAPLGLRCETTWPLQALSTPGESTVDAGELFRSPACELLLDRIRRRRPGYEPTREDAPILADVARRLDGVPLAIELAAGRIARIGPTRLIEEIDRDPGLLDRSAEPRGTTSMHRAIDRSWAALSLIEQMTLAECSVFRGGFTLAAAGAVVDAVAAGGPLLDVLDRLCDQSLVRASTSPASPVAEPRFSMRFSMYESIRAYAEERLRAAGRAQQCRERHALYYLESAGPDDVDSTADSAARLAQELDNLVAAHRWAATGRPATVENCDLVLGTALRLDAALWPLGSLGRLLPILDGALQAARAGPCSPSLLARALV